MSLLGTVGFLPIFDPFQRSNRFLSFRGLIELVLKGFQSEFLLWSLFRALYPIFEFNTGPCSISCYWDRYTLMCATHVVGMSFSSVYYLSLWFIPHFVVPHANSSCYQIQVELIDSIDTNTCTHKICLQFADMTGFPEDSYSEILKVVKINRSIIDHIYISLKWCHPVVSKLVHWTTINT